jgi:hypothetical protein
VSAVNPRTRGNDNVSSDPGGHRSGDPVGLTGPALAFQCPKLISKIHDEADSRFDDASYDARRKADEAEALHKAGKHAEAEKAAKEGLARIGVN